MSRSLKADQVAAAFVTAPGSYIQISNYPSPPVSIDTDDTWKAFMPSTSFVVSFAGEYALQHVFQGFAYAFNANTTFSFKLVIDEGTADEQTLGGLGIWTWRMYNEISNVSPWIYTGAVTLSAGAHTAKAYGYRHAGGGSTNKIDFNSGLSSGGSWVTLRAVTGSGAGGTLLSYKTDTVDRNNSTPGTPLELTALENAFTVAEGEDVAVTLHMYVLKSGGTYPDTCNVSYKIDSGSWVLTYRHWIQGAAYPGDVSLAFPLTGLSAGPHTIKWGVYIDGAGTIGVANTSIPAKSAVWQYRGGLVPHKNDNVLVQDKPVAVNYLGPGLQATNVGGQVNVAVQSAAEGVEVTKTTVVTGPLDIPTANETLITSVDVEVVEGETVLVSYVGTLRCDTPGQNIYTHLLLRDDATWDGSTPPQRVTGGTLIADYVLQPFNSGSDNQNASFTYPAVGLSAGTHTISVSVDTSLPYAEIYYYQLAVTRFRGGYVQPENIPILAYSSASQVSVASAPGADSEIRALLNDGVRRRATAPLTIDLTVSGEGGLDTGSEAVSTWYYCYLVPTAADDSVLNAVCSVTDPDSGGPTGFTAWKYLGAIYNESSGDLRIWFQDGPNFYASPPGLDLGTSADGSPVQLSLATVIPVTAQSCHSILMLHASGVGVDTWPDGLQGGASWRQVYAGSGTVMLSVPDYPTPASRYVYYKKLGAVTFCYWIPAGWRDGHLSAPQAQAQAQYLPDSASPKGTWATVSTVNFAARPGQPSTTRLTLQEGKQRTASGMLAWAIANGVADLGYDEAGSQGNSKWLYFYAVPKSGDDNQLTVRASDNPPSTGPAGYSNWKLIWSTYIDGSGNLIKVYQEGKLFRRASIDGVDLGSGVDASPVSYSLTSLVPETAGAWVGAVWIFNNASAQSIIKLWADGDTAATQALSAYARQTSDSASISGEVPTPTSPKVMYYQRTCASGTPEQASIHSYGWIDEWIDS